MVLESECFFNVESDGKPFDNGEFGLIEESINTPWPDHDPLHFTADLIQWPEEWQEQPVLVKSLV